MKITVNQNSLSKAISIAQKGLSNRSTMPILGGLLLKATEGSLSITGTDLEIGIETKVDCETIEPGNIVVTSRVFGEIIRKLPNEEIKIEVDDNNNIHVKCMNSKFNILGQDYEEYPELPQINKERSFSIEKDLLKDMINKTKFAIAQDETRPILTGALLEIENEEATLVALDGYRLALKKVKIDLKDKLSLIIPGKTLIEVASIIDDSNSTVEVSTTNNHIIFGIGNTVITSRLLEGQFLSYRDIVRNEYNTKVKVNTRELQNALERASLLAREGKNNLVKISIDEDYMVINSNSETGDINEMVPIEMLGDSMEIAFNSKYIMDGIKAIDSEEINMYLVGNVHPCIINPVNDPNYTYLILPVRLA